MSKPFLLMANDDAARELGDNANVGKKYFIKAAEDYFPSRDLELLDYMELLAVFESSSRRFLPRQIRKYDSRRIGFKIARITPQNRQSEIKISHELLE